MKQQPDKLFNDKLRDFSQPAPDGLWDRIEERMDNKRSLRPFYLRIAAAVLLLAVAAYGAYQISTSTSSTQIASNTPSDKEPVKNDIPAIKNPETNESRQQVSPDQSDNKSKVEDENATKSPSIIKQKDAVKKLNADKQITLAALPDVTTTTDIPHEDVIDTTRIHPNGYKVQLAYKAPKKETSTIVFTQEQTREYLVAQKNNDNSEATSDEKKSSTLRKLLKKAADISTNQDPLGELRQKKNEILALNFKSDKRGQKK